MSLPAKVLVLGGANGLLGRAVVRALGSAGVSTVAASSADADLLDETDCAAFLDRHAPELVVNAVAYTAVDRAEDEPEAAYRLNRDLPALLGRLAKARGITLVHYSTDFVFDGAKGEPYTPQDAPHPLSVYGASKLAGERALLELDIPGLLLLRTAWLFGPGKMNFVQRILELAAERPELKVVDDQHGSPTLTTDLAEMTLDLLRADTPGLFHCANSGQASWFELAAEAVRLKGLPCQVLPIPTSGYPTRAARPPYSVLDLGALIQATGKTPRPWREALTAFLAQNPG